MFFDSHSHVDDEMFNIDRDELILSLPEKGIDFLMNVGSDLPSSRRAVILAKRYPFIYAAVGIHPSDTSDMTDDDLAEIIALTQEKKVQAIGEIGLDYHYDNTNRELQKKWFDKQMQVSQELNLPFIIHDRDAHQDCLDVLRKYDIKKTGGVMHCFSGSLDMAKEVIKMGMVISIAGPVTYKNAAKTVNVVKEIPLEYILIETDCPYLSPAPHRGERNNPANVRFVAEKIADLKGLSVEEVAKITLENAKRLFRID